MNGRFGAIVNYAVIAAAGLLLISLARNIVSARQSIATIEKKKEDVEKLKEENDELRRNVESVSSQEFVEKQIRDQLGLAREGEVVLVLPEDEVLRRLVPELPKEEEELPDPIWKKWMKLFI